MKKIILSGGNLEATSKLKLHVISHEHAIGIYAGKANISAGNIFASWFSVATRPGATQLARMPLAVKLRKIKKISYLKNIF